MQPFAGASSAASGSTPPPPPPPPPPPTAAASGALPPGGEETLPTMHPVSRTRATRRPGIVTAKCKGGTTRLAQNVYSRDLLGFKKARASPVECASGGHPAA